MTQSRYQLPAPLSFLDKHGKTMLTILMLVLFTASLLGYLYLNFLSKSLDVTETLLSDGNFDVLVIHPARVRPGQIGNLLIIKLVPSPSGKATTSVTVELNELNPAYLVMSGENEKVFVPPFDRAQMQSRFDVVNTSGLPKKLEFRVTVTYNTSPSANETFAINVSRLSAEQFTLISTIVTGAISIWLFIGQEIIKFILPKKK